MKSLFLIFLNIIVFNSYASNLLKCELFISNDLNEVEPNKFYFNSVMLEGSDKLFSRWRGYQITRNLFFENDVIAKFTYDAQGDVEKAIEVENLLHADNQKILEQALDERRLVNFKVATKKFELTDNSGYGRATPKFNEGDNEKVVSKLILENFPKMLEVAEASVFKDYKLPEANDYFIAKLLSEKEVLEYERKTNRNAERIVQNIPQATFTPLKFPTKNIIAYEFITYFMALPHEALVLFDSVTGKIIYRNISQTDWGWD